MKYLLLLLLMLSASCADVPTQSVLIGPSPTHEQSVVFVEQFIHSAYVDPYSIQDLSVELPIQSGSAWQIYYSCNAKNQMGGYTGLKRSRVTVRNNQIDWSAQNSDAFWNAAYEGVMNH